MPIVGLEYRYPLINVQPWGTTTVEPIAQVIVRPNETNIGKLPNEDAQSFVFDDGNLFKVDKFSGWDRVEGGGRVNVGVQLDHAVQPRRLRQRPVRPVLPAVRHELVRGRRRRPIPAWTAASTPAGPTMWRASPISRTASSPSRRGTASTRTTSTCSASSSKARANFDRCRVQALYGNYATQPELGFLNRREGILGGVSYKVTQNWAVLAAARYDIDAHKFDQTRLGVGYIDDCLILALNYITNYTYSGNRDHGPPADDAAEPADARRTSAGTTGVSGIGGF